MTLEERAGPDPAPQAAGETRLGSRPARDLDPASRRHAETRPEREGGSAWAKVKTVAVAIFTVLFVGFKYLKLALLPILKFLPVILKTGGTMAISIGFYATMWGWKFALGFVLLLFVHECGHLVVARRFGLPVSAPMFIPFLGAFIALKGQPRNAWVEAMVGIGGPALGALGAFGCGAIGLATGNDFWFALAYSGCLLNLFNLIPIGQLDGGRIAVAISPWLWLVGLAMAVAMTVWRPNLVLIIVLVSAIPRLISLFRAKSDAEREYLDIPGSQRFAVALMYFALAGALAWGMEASHVVPRR